MTNLAVYVILANISGKSPYKKTMMHKMTPDYLSISDRDTWICIGKERPKRILVA